MLRIDERPAGEVMILDLNGKIRVGGTVALTDAVRTLVGQGWPAIVLNLSEVTQVDSAGFGALRKLSMTLRHQGRSN